jgi:adenine deaminase
MQASILCTDDSFRTLVREARQPGLIAIAHGLEPLKAIQMATINPAEHFGVAREVGMIAPGRYGDVLVIQDLAKLVADFVIAKGRKVAREGEIIVPMPHYQYPAWVLKSVHLGHPLTESDFRLPAPGDGIFTAHVIGIIENQAPTRHLKLKVEAKSGEIPVDMKQISQNRVLWNGTRVLVVCRWD